VTFTNGAMARLSDHIGALIESHLTAKALTTLNTELEERVNAARNEITAKNELLLRSERLAVMGKLAAGLAHEINNPLGVISTCVHSLLLGDSSPDASKRSLEMILSEVQRISTLVRGLLDLSREQPLVLVETDVSDLVKQSLELVLPEAEQAGVEVRFHGDSRPATATVDRSQIQQVVVNLALNAIQAIEGSGSLDVSVRRGNTPDAKGELLLILFADSGPGMTAETIEKMFDPFFTTKQDTGGVGLGLSVSQSIVEKHGGTIVASSRSDHGTVFTVSLPVKERP
jgi:signal transduction histidine kinase